MEYQNNPKGRQMFILDELKINSSLSFSDMFSKCFERFSISEVTFSKDWVKVQTELKHYQEAIKNAKLEESIKIEKEAVRRKILTKLEAMEILTEIAEGKAKKIDGKIIIPSFTDRSRAIETLGKFDGWNAPTETNVKLTNQPPIFNENPLNE